MSWKSCFRQWPQQSSAVQRISSDSSWTLRGNIGMELVGDLIAIIKDVLCTVYAFYINHFDYCRPSPLLLHRRVQQWSRHGFGEVSWLLSFSKHMHREVGIRICPSIFTSSIVLRKWKVVSQHWRAEVPIALPACPKQPAQGIPDMENLRMMLELE